ncbi:hypothetical protein [Neolewinella litorea]|uniref:DUF4296 domain-containing protein n=1 Tax=Neolewinella litorea TaxID=2562452 RepID=A0A4S4NHJ5_9BACT|nr:hypothetical protein [Neolewinella litorea]THH35570.1 hypothetical protein E4021_15890 [Neolewinella litorea]
MRARLATVSMTLLLLGCAEMNPGPPPVDTARFGRVIGDLQLAEALVAEVPVLVRDSMQAVYYDSVLADHGFTRREFDSIMWIIRQEPAWIDSVYTRAGEIVSREMIER